MLNKTKTILLIGLLLFLALIVRLYGLNFPLYHWDEKLDFGNTLYASFNQLSLAYYNHGSLLNYLVLACWGIYLLWHGEIPSSGTLLVSFFEQQETFALVGRFLMVLVSILAVQMVYDLGKRLYSVRVGVLAAFFLAFNFLHVSQSHYVRGHIFSTLFVSLAVLSIYKIYEKQHPFVYIQAGIGLGLSTAVHIPLAILFFPFVITHIFLKPFLNLKKSWKSWLLDRSFLLGLVSGVTTFFIVTPYALLDMPNFMMQLKFYILQAANQVWVSSEGLPILFFYVVEHLKNGMGIGLEILAFIGVAYALWKHNWADIVLLLFSAFLVIVLSGKANFARYALPLLPLLMIFAARFLVDKSKHLPSRWQILALSGLAIVLVFPSMINIVRYDYWLTQPDTRELARVWFVENIPIGAKVVSEGADVLSVDLPLSVEFLEQRISQSKEGGYTQFYNQALLNTASSKTGYQFIELFKLDEKHSRGTVEAVKDAAFYQRNDVEYLISVSWMQRSLADAYSPEFQTSLDVLYKEIAIFEPTILFRWDPYAWRMDYEALSRVRLGDAVVGGPRLVIYQLR